MKEHWGELLCVWKGNGILTKARYSWKKNHYSNMFLSLLGHWSESLRESYKLLPCFLFPHSLDSGSSTSDRSRKFWYSSCAGIYKLLIKLLLLLKKLQFLRMFLFMIISFEHCYIVIILYKKVQQFTWNHTITCSPLGNL